MANLLEPKGTIDPQGDPDGLFRAQKYDLDGEEITLIKVPYAFTKKTKGAERGPDFLAAQGLTEGLRSTKASVKELNIDIGNVGQDEGSYPNIRYRDETIRLAQQGGDAIEQALRSGSKVVILRGAHDAMDLAGLLRATNGNVAVIIVDTHADVHKPLTSISKNPHGMWVRSLLDEETDGFDPIMKGVPRLKPENLIYIGLSQVENPEVEYLKALKQKLKDKGPTIITSDALAGGLDKVYEALDAVQKRVPVWLDIDEDALVDAAATMPGGEVLGLHLKQIAKRIGTNQKLQGMHQVLGVGVSEFQPPAEHDEFEQENGEKQAEVINSAVHQALGAGYPESGRDEGVAPGNIMKLKRRGPIPAPHRTLRNIAYGTAAAAMVAMTTVGAFLAGKSLSDQSAKTGDGPKEVLVKGFPEDEGSIWTGMATQATLTPSFHAGWKETDFESDFSRTAKNYKHDLSKNDKGLARGNERALLSLYLAALDTTRDNPVRRAEITRHARETLGDDLWQPFTQEIINVQSDPREMKELRWYMKLFNLG